MTPFIFVPFKESASSGYTLLRLLRRLPDDPVEPPRVVSLDDWAWRKGHRYGTIICDLERHCRLDVLPDQDATSVAAWLKRYPSIEIISRDRSDTYATAARLGAPQAIQVTDKWHLLKNVPFLYAFCSLKTTDILLRKAIK